MCIEQFYAPENMVGRAREDRIAISVINPQSDILVHDARIKWKRLPRCWTFVREIHRSLVNYPHKGQ